MESGFSKTHVRKVLRGDLRSVWAAFTWEQAPQGHEHWYNIARGAAPLTAEDRAFLESLLEDGE